MISINQFDIWIADLNPGKGNIPGKIRPVIIVQTNFLNKVSHPTTIVCPLTSDIAKDSKILRLNILSNSQNGLEKNSAILVDQIRTIDNTKLLQRIGRVDESYHLHLKKSISTILDL